MSLGSSSGAAPFGTTYASALDDYLRDPTETTLRVAYELGRQAVSRHLSVLDLAIIHQEAVLPALADTSGNAEVQHVARAAGDFFLESLSSFEMVQRGFKEARQAFLRQRRQTELSRQLSTFLGDACLALDASDSLEEILRLVAEQARELIGAECCVATIAAQGQPRIAEGASHPQADRRWTTVVRWLDLPATYRFMQTSGGSARIAGEQLARLSLFHTADDDPPVHGWLAASLTALDGSELGVIQLFEKQHGAFTDDDEAALVHLAQMASAAVERTRLYQNRS
ncbi:MAG TPA: phosphatase RsbU N-terminal domain-containing protein [Solirubrobacteraceae bacterium]